MDTWVERCAVGVVRAVGDRYVENCCLTCICLL